MTTASVIAFVQPETGAAFQGSSPSVCIDGRIKRQMTIQPDLTDGRVTWYQLRVTWSRGIISFVAQIRCQIATRRGIASARAGVAAWREKLQPEFVSR